SAVPGAPARDGAPRPSASRGVPASTASVDTWATVAIPTDDPVAESSGSSMGDSGPSWSAGETGGAATATAVAAPPVVASDPVGDLPVVASDPVDDLPDDADAPPEDLEPPFDPGPAPDVVGSAPVPTPKSASAPAPAPAPQSESESASASVPSSASASASAAAPVRRGGSGGASADGIQRYGEAVVREVLGATFLEEVEAPGRPGFGERG
ncbi:hypothetical protein ACFWN7_13690, partial [Agromyces sp. NPDC058484]